MIVIHIHLRHHFKSECVNANVFPSSAMVTHTAVGQRDMLVMKQFSSSEIASAATALLAVVVESSRVFHVVG